MNKPLLDTIYKNFNEIFSEQYMFPLMLAFSGGADSTCLLLCLLKYMEIKKIKKDIHIVMIQDTYFNCGNEKFLSYIEGLLSKMPNLIFHVIKSSVFERQAENGEVVKNIQSVFREERFKAIQGLFKKHKCNILLLAHNADDQAETVFKRIFESACITKMYGFSERDIVFNMPVLRPLIGCRKLDILKFVKLHNAVYEPYVSNDLYTRDRIRDKILPYIAQNFGKEVVFPLCRVAKQGKMINDYFNKRLRYIVDNISITNGKCFIEKKKITSLEDIEVFFFLKTLVDRIGINVSFDSLIDAVNIVKNKNKSNKMISFHKGFFMMDEKGAYIDMGNHV